MRTLILGIFIVAEVVVVGLLAGCGATFDYNALRPLIRGATGSPPHSAANTRISLCSRRTK